MFSPATVPVLYQQASGASRRQS